MVGLTSHTEQSATIRNVALEENVLMDLRSTRREKSLVRKEQKGLRVRDASQSQNESTGLAGARLYVLIGSREALILAQRSID